MGKLAPDAFLDAALNYAGEADYLCVCSDTPTTYTDAYTTYMLAKVAVDSGDFTKADDTSGRKVTVGAQTGVSITNSGTATHVALVKTGDTTLRFVTTCTSQVITAGGTVDTPAWKISIADPT
jgi:hypothetical protein